MPSEMRGTSPRRCASISSGITLVFSVIWTWSMASVSMREIMLRRIELATLRAGMRAESAEVAPRERERARRGDGPEVDAVEDELDVAVFGQLGDLDAQVGAVVRGRRLERELANNALHDEEAREVERGRAAAWTRLDAVRVE